MACLILWDLSPEASNLEYLSKIQVICTPITQTIEFVLCCIGRHSCVWLATWVLSIGCIKQDLNDLKGTPKRTISFCEMEEGLWIRSRSRKMNMEGQLNRRRWLKTKSTKIDLGFSRSYDVWIRSMRGVISPIPPLTVEQHERLTHARIISP